MKKRTSDTGSTRALARRRRMSPSAMLIAIIALAAVAWAAVRTAALRVVIIGDSTAYTYTAADSLRGWGQELGLFFDKGAVTVINKALGGRSSRSFIEDGHWASALALIQKGDIVLISFGTNDRGTVAERHTDTAGFRLYLTQYVTESRAKGAIPVLISTVNQNSWNGTTFTEGFNIGVNDYHGAMLRVVNALSVPFIDLEQKTATLFKSLGESYLANFIFIAGATHFQEMGAINIAKLIAQGIQELATDPDVGKLSAVVAPQYMMTVTSNKTGAGMVTASGNYPQDAPITLKVMPNSGQTFQQWRDADGKSLSTQKLYKFTMGSAACSYTAAFQGGTTSVSRAKTPSVISQSPSMTLSGKGMVSINSNSKILSVHVSDLSGRMLVSRAPNGDYATLYIGPFPHGTFAVSTRTNSGVTTQLVKR
jgi:lysophospholipase L1-like esterase